MNEIAFKPIGYTLGSLPLKGEIIDEEKIWIELFKLINADPPKVDFTKKKVFVLTEELTSTDMWLLVKKIGFLRQVLIFECGAVSLSASYFGLPIKFTINQFIEIDISIEITNWSTVPLKSDFYEEDPQLKDLSNQYDECESIDAHLYLEIKDKYGVDFYKQCSELNQIDNPEQKNIVDRLQKNRVRMSELDGLITARLHVIATHCRGPLY